ncbi:MAG: DUF4870 domain-containing protein [Pirellulales bacterium]|nr:DUF4870 domain-containing protein [Pirellulales bacterium]
MSDSANPNPYDSPPPTHDELEFTPTHDERNLAVIAHLSGCAGIILGGLVGFIGPLVIYLMKKDSSPYVEAQAKEALNFQITLLLIMVVCIILTVASCGFLFPIAFVPTVLQVYFGIVAGLAVKDGDHYRYPFNLRLMQ